MLAEMLTGLIVLGLALLAGALAAFLLRNEAPAATATRTEDLEERLAHVLAHLKDLMDQEGRLAPAELAQDRARLEQEAARLLRERDAVTTPTPIVRSETPTAVVGFFARHPSLTGFLWGGATVGVVALLYGLVVAEQAPRVAGGSMTGGPVAATGSAPAPQGADTTELTSLLAHLRDKPDDVAALVRLAHVLLRGQMLSEAKVVNDRALLLDPKHEEALVHAAVLTSVDAPDTALAELNRLVAKNPRLAEAWFFRGMLGMRANDQGLMRESWEKYLAVAEDGPQKERVRAMLSGQGGR